MGSKEEGSQQRFLNDLQSTDEFQLPRKYDDGKMVDRTFIRSCKSKGLEQALIQSYKNLYLNKIRTDFESYVENQDIDDFENYFNDVDRQDAFSIAITLSPPKSLGNISNKELTDIIHSWSWIKSCTFTRETTSNLDRPPHIHMFIRKQKHKFPSEVKDQFCRKFKIKTYKEIFCKVVDVYDEDGWLKYILKNSPDHSDVMNVDGQKILK